MPWEDLLALIEPFYPKAGNGRRPYPLETIPRIHLLQNWFALSDPAMEEALYEITSLRQFTQLSLTQGRILEDTTIMNFHHLLEKHRLAPSILAVINGYPGDQSLSLHQGTIVDATIVRAPSSTKNQDDKRDPQMHQTKKGNQYYFGIKAHIGADAESGLVHSVVGTAANVADVTQVDQLLHGEENVVCADAGGYTEVEKRAEHSGCQLIWQIAARRNTYKNLSKRLALYKAKRKIERAKAQVRAKVEHPFRVIKRQLHQKVYFRDLAKNTAHLVTLFALSNLWMVRRHLLTDAREVRL